MYHVLNEIFSYSVGIAAIIGLIRIRKIDPSFYPFIILLWLGILTEIATTILIRKIGRNAEISNVYVLLESLVIMWQFQQWRFFERYRAWFPITMIAFVIAWVVENFFVSDIHHFNSYFRIFYSFLIVLMSISQINHLIAKETKGIVKNAIFLILVGFIIFFAYKTMVEIFWAYGVFESKTFQANVYRIMNYVNLAVNLIFALAVLWIPGRQKYTLL